MSRHKPLPSVGSVILSRYGREMRVIAHCLRPGHVEVKPVVPEPTNRDATALWPVEWCVCEGETLPIEYFISIREGEIRNAACRTKLIVRLLAVLEGMSR